MWAPGGLHVGLVNLAIWDIVLNMVMLNITERRQGLQVHGQCYKDIMLPTALPWPFHNMGETKRVAACAPNALVHLLKTKNNGLIFVVPRLEYSEKKNKSLPLLLISRLLALRGY